MPQHPRTLLALVSAAALAAVALTACAGPAPAAAPSSAPPAAAAPTPSASTPPAAVPAELVVTSSGVELYDSVGALVDSFEWPDETADALAVLELAFGPAPAPTVRIGDSGHYSDVEEYAFAGGFTYFSAINLGKPRDEYFLPSSVQVDTGEQINGVSIRTADGLQVGGTLADVQALAPPRQYDHPLGIAYLVDPEVPSLVFSADEATDMVAAIVDPDGTLMRIIAPYPSQIFF